MAYDGDNAVHEESLLSVLQDIRKLLKKLVVLNEEGMGFQVNDNDVDS